MKLFSGFLLIGALVSYASKAQPGADSMLNFIKANKSKAALFVVQNDTVLAKLNENKLMPLASTVKIMVALEFAKQAAQKVFNKESLVPVSELEKYYLPNTDAGMHPAWLVYENKLGHIKNDSVSLNNVARGMMMFSSNANTEFLMDLLGLDNVKNNLQLLGIKQHTAIYPLVSSLFMYQNPNKKTEESIIKGIKKLSDEQYSRYLYDMHKALKYDTVLKNKFRPQDLNMKMQKTWSDRLTASTVKEYAKICNVLNNRRYFSKDTYAVLAGIMETIMENPANQQWLQHAGMKGGSTAWVLTKVMYATTKDGNRLELAYFFNDLAPTDNLRMQQWMNDFELRILSDKNFRQLLANYTF